MMRLRAYLAGLWGPALAFFFAMGYMALAQQVGPVAGPGGPGNPSQPVVTQNGHIAYSGQGTPAASSCGSGPTVIGTDTIFQLVPQQSTCTITFAHAYSLPPICDMNIPSATANPTFTVTPSTMTIANLTTGAVTNAQCYAQPGGN